MCFTEVFSRLGGYANYVSIPPVAVLLMLGFLILFSDFKKMVNRIYFAITFFLSVWIVTDFLSYKFTNPVYILWAERVSAMGLVAGALIVLFVYMFPEKKVIPRKIIVLVLAPLAPFFALVPTKFYNEIGPVPVCESMVGPVFYLMVVLLAYYIILGVIFSLQKIKSLDTDQKKQFKLFSAGAILMIFLGIIVDVLPTIFNNESIVFFAPYTTIVFAAFGAYAIVRHNVLNVKVMATQLFVFVLFVLIASEFLFISMDNIANVVLISGTVLLSTIVGMMLINSVREEVRRKEELQEMSSKLAQANDKLRTLDNAKSEFISIASHQLRTPLTAIRGFLSLLLEGAYGKLNSKQEDALNKAYTSNDRLINLVEDLLNVSRMESGRMEFKFAPSNLADICKEVTDTFYIKAKERELDLDYKMPEQELPRIMVDGVKIKEVISNLVDNALKYTPKGGVKVRVSQNGEKLRVTVSDTGIGIPATELPYLFAKFSRGKEIGRLNTGGTGLGLYVGKSIVEANGGQIWAESDGENQGSRFIVELPIKQSPELLERWG